VRRVVLALLRHLGLSRPPLMSGYCQAEACLLPVGRSSEFGSGPVCMVCLHGLRLMSVQGFDPRRHPMVREPGPSGYSISEEICDLRAAVQHWRRQAFKVRVLVDAIRTGMEAHGPYDSFTQAVTVIPDLKRAARMLTPPDDEADTGRSGQA